MRSFLLPLLLLAAAPLTVAAGQKSELVLALDTPHAGDRVGSRSAQAFVAGHALSRVLGSGNFDVIVVIDTSGSTGAPSGADVDADGSLGRRWGSPYVPFLPRLLQLPSSDRGDTVLAAEVAATQALMAHLDPRTTRVGVVSFAGNPRASLPHAELAVPLTRDYDAVRQVLDHLLEIGPAGQTNILAAVELAAQELLGEGESGRARAASRPIILFMTDGVPTLPAPGRHSQNARLAIAAAERAGLEGVRIDTFAIGEEAADKPLVTSGMAEATGGTFTSVADPRELLPAFRSIQLAEVRELRIRNVTTGQAADYQVLEPDGRFAGLVPVRKGWNDLEVLAHGRDGSRQKLRVRVRYRPERDVSPLPPRLAEWRERLLRNRLAELRERSVELELERERKLQRGLRELEPTPASPDRDLDVRPE